MEDVVTNNSTSSGKPNGDNSNDGSSNSWNSTVGASNDENSLIIGESGDTNTPSAGGNTNASDPSGTVETPDMPTAP